MNNFFTGLTVPAEFSALVYDQSVTIDNTQLPYYSIPPAKGKTVTVADCAKAPTATDDYTVSELNFLDMLGLILRDATGAMFVSSKARDAFYAHGFFSGATPSRNDQIRSALQLFSEYTIPARMAWLDAAGRISDSIEPQLRREQELAEMRRFALEIRSLL